MAEPIGTVFVDVLVNDEKVRANVQSAFKEAFKATVYFDKKEVRAAFEAALLGAPLVAHAKVVFDDKGVVRAVEQTQKKITAAEAKEHPKRLTQQKKINGLIELEQEKSRGRILLAEEVSLRQSNAIKARAEATELRFQRAQELRAQRLRDRLARINSKPIALRVTDNLGQVSQSLRGFDQVASRVLRTTLTAFTLWSTGVVAAFAAVGVAALNTTIQVEKSASRAAGAVASAKIADEISKNGKATSDFGTVAAAAQDKITKSAARIGLETLFNTQEVSEGILALVQSGQSLDDAILNIESAARGASVSGEELGLAAEGLAAGLSASGLAASDSALLLDKFQFVANDTLGNVGDVTDAFANKSASSFKTYKRSVDETLLVLDLFGKTGIKGQTAGTDASIVIRDLDKAIGNSGEKFKKYGIRIADADHQNVTLVQTLTDLSKVFGGLDGTAGARQQLIKDLGFQGRSFQFIAQILPQIQKLGEKGLNIKLDSISGSKGAIDDQFELIKKQLFFQLDQLKDTFSNALLTIGNAAAKQTAGLVNVFAGNDGLVSKITPELEKLGAKIGDTLAQFAQFAQTKNFANGIKTIAEALKVTILGVAEAFKQFSSAFNDGKKAQSTFESFADAVLAFSQASAAVLPQVAKAIGETIKFLIDHPDAFEVFAKAAIGVYALNKAFTLFVAPVAAAVKGVLSIRKALVEARVVAAALSEVEAGAGIAAIETSLAGAATAAGIFAAVVVAGAGAITAGFSEFKRQTQDIEGFKEGIEGIGAAFSVIVPVVKGIIELVFRVGEAIGRFTARIVASFVELGGGIVKAFSSGSIIKGLSILSDAIINFLLAPIRSAIAFIVDEAGGLLDALGDVPGVGDKFEGAADKLKNLSNDIADFRVDITGMRVDIDSTDSSVEGATGAFTNYKGAVDKAATAANGLDNSLGFLGTGFNNLRSIANNAARAAARDAIGIAASAAAAQAEIATLANVPVAGKQLTPQQRFEAEIKGMATTAFSTPGIKRGLAILAKKRSAAFNKAQKDEAKKPGGDDTLTPVDTPVGGAAPKARDLSAEAAARVEALNFDTRNKKTRQLIDKIDKAGAKGYKATRFEAALLERALPGIDKALELQRNKVSQLSDALSELRSTQIAGTKAFSDAAFANEQAVKQLQLARLDALAVPGTTDASQNIKDLDAQIQSLQTSAERASLVEALQLDPLKRKLEDTFNPVKELPFDQIVSRFQQLNAEQATQQAKLSSTERIQKLLSETNSAAADNFRRVDAAASAAASSVSSVGSAAASATTSVKTLGAANSDLSDEGGDLTGSLTAGITEGAGNVSQAILGILNNARAQFTNAALPGSVLQINTRTAGFATALSFAAGVRAGFRERVIPQVRGSITGVGAVFVQSLAPDSPLQLNVRTAGFSIMSGFLKGMTDKFGADTKAPGTIAHFLNVFIPEWIKENKGPVAYDATILVPAGQAVMDGFGSGLRSGFSQIQQFVKDVGPSLSEFISADAFSGRTATIMADIALGKKPDIDGVFGDLRNSMTTTTGFYPGLADPSLSFLHPTLSLADTTQQAFGIIKALGGGLNTGGPGQLGRPDGSTANNSRHEDGVAADIGTSSSHPTPASLRLFESAKKMLGTIFKQIIHNGVGINAGGGTFSDSNHFDHVHLEWLEGLGFSENSGRIGAAAAALLTGPTQGPVRVTDIPGASPAVDAAISSAALRWQLPVALLAAVAKQESGFRPNVVSFDGGYGLFQLTSQSLVDAADKMGGRLNPQANAFVGAKYLHDLIKQLGSIPLGLSAYNSGPGGGERSGRIDVPGYVGSVLRYFEEFKKQFGGFREFGGGVQPSRSYIVGERGPELFTPQGAGRITNARDTARMTQGGPQMIDNSVVNITTAASDPRVIARQIEINKRRDMQRVSLR